MKSEVIALTSFVKDGRTDAQTDAEHFYVPPNGFAMAGDNNPPEREKAIEQLLINMLSSIWILE